MTPKIHASQGAYVRIALDVRSLRCFPPLYGELLTWLDPVGQAKTTDARRQFARENTPVGLCIPALKDRAFRPKSG